MARLREPIHMSGVVIETPRCCVECPLFGSDGIKLFCKLPEGPNSVLRTTRSDSCPLRDYTFDFEANQIRNEEHSGDG